MGNRGSVDSLVRGFRGSGSGFRGSAVPVFDGIPRFRGAWVPRFQRDSDVRGFRGFDGIPTGVGSNGFDATPNLGQGRVRNSVCEAVLMSAVASAGVCAGRGHRDPGGPFTPGLS